jgi:hypothetical protein
MHERKLKGQAGRTVGAGRTGLGDILAWQVKEDRQDRHAAQAGYPCAAVHAWNTQAGYVCGAGWSCGGKGKGMTDMQAGQAGRYDRQADRTGRQAGQAGRQDRQAGQTGRA